MIVWIVLIVYLIWIRLLFCNFKNKKNQKYYLILSGIAIILVMALRYPHYEGVYDLSEYYKFYKIVGLTPWSEIFTVVSRFEPGYVILNKFLYIICPWQQTILIVEAIVSVFCISYFIYKNSDDPFLGIMFYVTLGVMTFQLTGFRQSFAMSICLLSIECIKNKNLKKFILLNLLAMSFHKTAMIFLPAYFILNNKINLKTFIYTIVLLITSEPLGRIITILGNYILEKEYSGVDEVGMTGWLINMSIYMIILIVSTIYYKYIKNTTGINLTIITMVLFNMRNVTAILGRVSLFFSPGIIISLPEVINIIKNDKLKILIKYIAISLSIILFLYRSRSSDWINYKFFWQ